MKRSLNLRSRIALIVAFVAVALAVTGHLIQRRYVYREFASLERREAVDMMARARAAIADERAAVALWCRDWAAWDDLYNYLRGDNDAFVAENINDQTLANTQTDYWAFVRPDGTVLRAVGRHHETGARLGFPELPADRFPRDHPLLRQRGPREAVEGVVRTAHGPLLVVSNPSLRTDFSGPPAGWFIAGRLLTPATVRRLSERARLRLHAWSVDDPARDRRGDGLAPGAARVVESGESAASVFDALEGLDGRPAARLRVDVPRDITRQGARALRLATLSFAAASLTLVAVLALMLGLAVVRPLARLQEHAEHIGRSGDLSLRAGLDRGDEIGVLAAEFDAMVARLAESRATLAEAARRAGMADVARGVLHNVGNVLTSVNVSAAAVARTLSRSRAAGLLKGVDLLTQHRADLPAFLADDPRGRGLPEYLARAAEALREEHAALAAEAEKMQRAVAHAAEIVARQGEVASPARHAERVPLAALLDGAAALVAPSFRRHDVALEVRAPTDAAITTDQTRLLQVLVNLLTNAKEAVAARGAPGGRVTLRGEAAGGAARVTVEDDGCGVDPALLGRIFEGGFSTRREGRGYGLHFCAVTVRELGGSIRAASAGPGRGASFTLELPLALATASLRPPPPATEAAA